MKTVKIMKSHFSQRGNGLGSIFRSLAKVFLPVAKTVFRASKPALKQAAKETGRELLRTGVETIGDIAAGEDPKLAVKKNVKAGTKRALGKAKEKIQEKMSKMAPKSIKTKNPGRKGYSRLGQDKSRKYKTIFD